MRNQRFNLGGRGWLIAVFLALPIAFGAALLPARAQQAPFANGWLLNAENSTLAFQSVKNETLVEGSTFAVFSGAIDENGALSLEVALDSVDTKIDLRNVRMRFLFFETFSHPTAKVTAQLDPALLADLPSLRRKVLSLPFTLDLHGNQHQLTAQMAVVMITNDLVSVSAVSPVSVGVEQFGLLPGLKKLEEAANVKILPSGSVTFDLLFARNPGAASGAAQPAPTLSAGREPTPAAPAPAIAATTGPAPTGPAPAGSAPAGSAAPSASVALETSGDFSAEECSGRFEILSRGQSITFRTGSARLDPVSNNFLNALYDIVSRCPGMIIEIGGHTDADGSENANQQLSERRAAAVAEYLVQKGAGAARLQVKGYGEAQPIAANTSAEGKARNRRIEFKVVG